MKKYVLIGLALLLAGCQSTSIIDKQNVVVMPSNAIYDCPQLTYYPKPETLTDIEVAKLLKNIYANNVKCRNSINAIRKFLNDSKKTVK